MIKKKENILASKNKMLLPLLPGFVSGLLTTPRTSKSTYHVRLVQKYDARMLRLEKNPFFMHIIFNMCCIVNSIIMSSAYIRVLINKKCYE